MELGLVTFLLNISFRTASLGSVFQKKGQVSEESQGLLSTGPTSKLRVPYSKPRLGLELWPKGREPGPVQGHNRP